MRMLMIVTMDPEEFNAAVKDGSAGEKIGRILQETKHEAVYFTEMNGERTMMLIVDVEESSHIPSFAEPWFLTFNAQVQFHPVMTPDDLGKAGLEALGKKWG